MCFSDSEFLKNMATEDWIITTCITSLVIAAFQKPKFYKEYLYNKVFYLGMFLQVVYLAYTAGIYISVHAIPETLPKETIQSIKDAILIFDVPNKWYVAYIAIFIGNFFLEPLSNAVLKHEQ